MPEKDQKPNEEKAEEKPDGAGGESWPPETVTFEHNFFDAVEESYFRNLSDDGDPVMVMPLENETVTLSLLGIKHELELEAGSHDDRMLDTIVEALKYVRGIRCGDKVPSELTTGRASWEISDTNRMIARSRLMMQLVTWISGDEEVLTDAQQLAQVANDPVMKEKINEAFSEAAEKLGIGRDRRDEVVGLVDNLAEELSYIEALRERFAKVAEINKKVAHLAKIYASELSVMETLFPVERLMGIAVKGFEETFQEIDAQTGEILAVLQNIKSQTHFIRQCRDDLNRRLWAWDKIVEAWSEQEARRSPYVEKLLEELYHFLAERFLPVQEWELMSKAFEKTSEAKTSRTWT
jgi:hypothetical protein